MAVLIELAKCQTWDQKDNEVLQITGTVLPDGITGTLEFPVRSVVALGRATGELPRVYLAGGLVVAMEQADFHELRCELVPEAYLDPGD